MISRLSWLAFVAAILVTILCFKGCDLLSAAEPQQQSIVSERGRNIF